jgi:hypothetical protein
VVSCASLRVCRIIIVSDCQQWFQCSLSIKDELVRRGLYFESTKVDNVPNRILNIQYSYSQLKMGFQRIQ